MKLRLAGAVFLLVAASITACGSGNSAGSSSATSSNATGEDASSAGGTVSSFTPTTISSPFPTRTATDATVRSSYPNLAALYGGDQGVYRSCSANFGVCHNGHQYPNLRSMEAILATIGAPCNQLREDPLEVHDWCELSGDWLRIGNREIEIGFFVPVSEDLRGWVAFLRESPPTLEGKSATIVRYVSSEARTLYGRLEQRSALLDVSEEVGAPAVYIGLPPAPVGGERDPGGVLLIAFLQAGIPGNPNTIQLGDPNRNGTFGADLGNALIVPGDPERSYLMHRLIDPEFGTLMPLANCCYWTKQSLRALWCWIAGLTPDGSNALDPIDYAACPDGPVENVLYPEPGPACETSGMCPVQSLDLPDGTGFAPVFSIMRGNCAGPECHIGGNAGNFPIPAEEGAAYDVVRTRVVPGFPDQSELFIRLDRTLCELPDCIPMPYGRPGLPEQNLDLIRQWIADGAHP